VVETPPRVSVILKRCIHKGILLCEVLSSGNVDPLTNQVIEPLLALQVKVAVDPSVVLTDLGVLMKAEI